MPKAEFYDVVNGLLGKETASGIHLGSRHLGSLMLDGICPSTMVTDGSGTTQPVPSERLAVVMLDRLRRDPKQRVREDHKRSYMVVQETPHGVRMDKAVPRRFMPKDAETRNYVVERPSGLEIGIPAGIIHIPMGNELASFNNRLVIPVIGPVGAPQLVAA